jgi:RNA polymerase sigma factor (sigma-70 family)
VQTAIEELPARGSVTHAMHGLSGALQSHAHDRRSAFRSRAISGIIRRGMSEEPEELIDAARRGSSEAFAELTRRHLDRIHAIVHLRRVASRQQMRRAEETIDVVQSAMLDVLRTTPSHELPATEPQFIHWMVKACDRKLIQRWRELSAQKRDVQRNVRLENDGSESSLLNQFAAALGTPSVIVSSREQIERVGLALSELDEDQRLVILLARICGYSHQQVADAMGRTELATRSLLSRSLARLTSILERLDRASPEQRPS